MRLKLFLLVTIIPLAMASPALGGNLFYEWSQVYGDGSGQQARDVATDGYGNVIITGAFSGVLDLGAGGMTSAGGQDIFLAKFDRDGVILWNRSAGSISSDYGRSVAVDPLGNIIVTGYFQGTVDLGGGGISAGGGWEVFVAKYDPNGNHIWSTAFGDWSDQYGQLVEVFPDGSIVCAGDFMSTVDFGGGNLTSAGSTDIFLVKFSSSGSHVWSQDFGGTSPDNGYGLAVDGSSNVSITGAFQGNVDFGGGILASLGLRDVFLAQYSSGGSHNWSQRFGDFNGDWGYSLDIDGSDNIVLLGYFTSGIDCGGGTLTSNGSTDVLLAKFTSAGSHVWSQSFGGSDLDKGIDVCVDPLDNVVITGYYKQQIDFGGGSHTSFGSEDIYVARFAANGDYIWSGSYGAADLDFGMGVKADGFGNVWSSGSIRGVVDLGGGPQSGGGGDDLYLLRHNLGPDIVAVRDVPSDQGGLVNVSWDACGVDNVVDNMVTEYTVWRAIEPALASEMIGGGAALVKDPSGIRAAAAGQRVIRAEPAEGAPFYWFLVTTVDAFYLPGYSAPIPTLFDSTAAANENHYFQVIAHTSTPTVFYTSNPDTGYSVDNIAPAMPLNLVGEQTMTPDGLELTWDANTEPDLSHYTVYRGTDAGFVPGPGNRIASPTDTTAFDSGWQWDGGYYYKVGAVDIHDNESLFAALGPDLVSDTRGRLPAVYLSQNFPNPFNPTTTISFGIDRAVNVSLRIYDASGHLVRTLVNEPREAQRHEVTWDGRDNLGHSVASGVYFYRLAAGQFEKTKKMVLLK